MRRRSLLVLNSVILSLIACQTSFCSQPLPAESDPAIVFMAYDSAGPSDLMVMNADGSNLRVLLPSADTESTPSAHRWPDWSPDGGQVVFASQMAVAPEGHPELTKFGPGLYIVASDGKTLCQVVKLNSIFSPHPDWSLVAPRGADLPMIVYADMVQDRPCRTGLCTQWDLFLVEATCDAPPPRNLTRTPQRDELYASWSPDARRIVATVDEWRDDPSQRHGDIVVFDVHDALLSAATRLGRPDGCLSALFPSWSPEGDRIAACCVGELTGDLWVRALGEKSWRRLIPTGGAGLRATWSPDGTQLVFDHEDDGSLTISDVRTRTSRELLGPKPGDCVRYIDPNWHF